MLARRPRCLYQCIHNLICVVSVLIFTLLCTLVGLSLRDVADDVGSGDSVDSYVEPGTVPFG